MVAWDFVSDILLKDLDNVYLQIKFCVKMMTVRKTSVFLAFEKEIFKRLQRLKMSQYVAYPMATYTPVNWNTKLIWKEWTTFSYKFKLFRIIPFSVNIINIICFGLRKGIYTNERLNTFLPGIIKY